MHHLLLTHRSRLLPLLIIHILVGRLRLLLVLTEPSEAHRWASVDRIEHRRAVLARVTFLQTS